MAKYAPLVLGGPEPSPATSSGRSPRAEAAYEIVDGREGLDGFLRGGETHSGAFVNAESAMRVAAVYRCVGIIAGAIGSLPWQLIRAEGASNILVKDHPLAKLFALRPNPRQTWPEFMKMLQAHALLRGNGYAAKIRSGSRILGFLPLHPDRVAVYLQTDLSVIYSYTRLDGTQVTYTQADILHLKDLSWDGVVGLSRISLMRETVGLALSAEKFGARVFKNDTTVASALKMAPGADLSDKAYSRLQESIEEYRGADNAGKMLILEQGMDFVRLGMTNSDAQFLETRKFQRTDIAMMFGVPPFLMGDTEKSTSWGTGLEQQNTGFLQYTLLDWITAWQHTLKRDALSDQEALTLTPTLDDSGFLRPSSKDRSEYFSRALGAGGSPAWMLVNEVRRNEGLNPVPGGDKLPVPTNVPNQPNESVDPAPGEDDDDDDENEGGDDKS